ncbi:MAG: GTP-binding protein [Kosmotogaceae bacterium]
MKKIFVITGFLGAGKTTFLNNLISLTNKKIEVVINEFGKIGFDGKQFKNSKINTFEINGGSIFCSCLEQDFFKTMKEIAKTDIEFVFIESSGLSDPSNIEPIISKITQKTKRGIKVEAIVTLVDASRFLKMIDVFPVIEKQIKAASTIIVNKTDLVSCRCLDETINILRKHNHKASLIETTHGRIEELSTIFGKVRILESETLNKPSLREKSILIESKNNLGFNNVRNFLESISGELLRIKGTFSTVEKNYYADCVGEQINIYETDNTANGLRLSVIASRNKPIVGYIRNNWSRFFDSPLTFR